MRIKRADTGEIFRRVLAHSKIGKMLAIIVIIVIKIVFIKILLTHSNSHRV